MEVYTYLKPSDTKVIPCDTSGKVLKLDVKFMAQMISVNGVGFEHKKLLETIEQMLNCNSLTDDDLKYVDEAKKLAELGFLKDYINNRMEHIFEIDNIENIFDLKENIFDLLSENR